MARKLTGLGRAEEIAGLKEQVKQERKKYLQALGLLQQVWDELGNEDDVDNIDVMKKVREFLK